MRGQARKVSGSVDRPISVLLCSANEIRRVFAPWCVTVWCSACAGAALQQRRAEKHRKEADSAEFQRSHSGLPCVQRSKDREYASGSKILVIFDNFSSFLMKFWPGYFDITQKMMKIMKNDEIHQEVFLATFLARSPPIARRRRFYPHIDIVKNCHVPIWLLR